MEYLLVIWLSVSTFPFSENLNISRLQGKVLNRPFAERFETQNKAQHINGP